MTARRSPHVDLRARIPATMYADMNEAAGRLTRAEKASRDARDIGRNLLVIGLETVRRCMVCAASMKCDLHGTEAVSLLRGNEAAPESESEVVDGAQYRKLVDAYFAAFESARGERPTFDGADGTAAKKLLRKLGIKRAIQVIKGAYSHKLHKTMATIRTIASDPSKHLGTDAGGGTLQADSGFDGGQS